MPLPLVSAADLAARYPAFADIDPVLVALVLDEARSAVADTWIEADQKPALLAYAAHILTLDGYGGGSSRTVTIGEEAVAVSGPVESAELGDAKIKFASVESGTAEVGSANAGGFAATVYGRHYFELLCRSNPGVLAV